MKRINWIFSLSSLAVLLVTIERFSFTTKIILQPYSFLRLHEGVQMFVIILLTVITPFLLLLEITSNFKTLQKRKDLMLILVFVVGVYFYATGNGLHEVSSFFFNTYCDTKNIHGQLCGGLFFNDYYTGNIFYFIGGIFMIVPLLFLEKERPNKNWEKKDLFPLISNAVIYAFAIFAYAAFDLVLVGLIYSVLMTVIAAFFFLQIRKHYIHYPVITYTLLTYALGTSAALVTRFAYTIYLIG